jgi:excisionase family DNA binding protein
MTRNDFQESDPSPGHRPGDSSKTQCIPDIIRYLTLALYGLVRRLQEEGLPMPPEVEELAPLLVRLACACQGPLIPADELEVAHHSRVPDQLLVTKAGAAELLAVSVRTIERLVATGRLSQIHVERSARFRVSDLEVYVSSLAESHATDSDSDSDSGEPRWRAVITTHSQSGTRPDREVP